MRRTSHFEMIKRSLLFITLIFFIFSCKRSDCFTTPKQAVFELVNTNGENVIETGTLQFSDIVISEDAGNGTFIGMHDKLTEDNKIVIEELGWYNGTKNYRFFTPDTTFTFSVKSSKIDSAGCNSFRMNEVNFINMTGNKENDFYKIVIK